MARFKYNDQRTIFGTFSLITGIMTVSMWGLGFIVGDSWQESGLTFSPWIATASFVLFSSIRLFFYKNKRINKNNL